jgi:heparanase
MAEVIGGNFWKPYAARKPETATKPVTAFEIGKDPARFERPPIDLANARLRQLAAALAPAYVRVSGTWANSVFFQDTEAVEAGPTPAGYQSVLTRSQWAGVIAFTRAVNAKLVTSFAISSGVRDADGIWTPVGQASRRLHKVDRRHDRRRRTLQRADHCRQRGRPRWLQRSDLRP